MNLNASSTTMATNNSQNSQMSQMLQPPQRISSY